jgi:hypothetical protein
MIFLFLFFWASSGKLLQDLRGFPPNWRAAGVFRISCAAALSGLDVLFEGFGATVLGRYH